MSRWDKLREDADRLEARHTMEDGGGWSLDGCLYEWPLLIMAGVAMVFFGAFSLEPGMRWRFVVPLLAALAAVGLALFSPVAAWILCAVAMVWVVAQWLACAEEIGWGPGGSAVLSTALLSGTAIWVGSLWGR